VAVASLLASYYARREPAGRCHRKQSVQSSGEYDDDDELHVGVVFHAQMRLPEQQRCA